MGRFIWTKEAVKEVALKYKTRTEFQKKKEGAYRAAWKKGYLDEVCSHMNKNKNSRKRWDLEAVKILAKKYKHRTDFKNENYGPYHWARKNNKLDIVCKHMTYKKKPIDKKKKKAEVKRKKKIHEPKPCEYCGKDFIPYHGGQLTCSGTDCYKHLRNKRARKTDRKHGQSGAIVDFEGADRSYCSKQGREERKRLQECDVDCLLDELGDIE